MYYPDHYFVNPPEYYLDPSVEEEEGMILVTFDDGEVAWIRE